MRRPRLWWLGLLCLFLVYSAYHILMFDMGLIYRLGSWERHGIKFGTAVLIFVVGTFFLKRTAQPSPWMWQLWNVVHIGGMLALMVLGAIDHWIMELSTTWRYFASRIHLFLISPMFYVAMGLLSKQLDRSASKED